MLLGELVEGAVVEHGDAVVERLRFEAACTQLREQPGSARGGARPPTELVFGVGGDELALVPGRLVDGAADGDATPMRALGRFGEDAPREP